jgi:UDP-galactopyranose mutase
MPAPPHGASAVAPLESGAKLDEAPGGVDRDFDLLIVGAGIVGCTVAERAAALRGWRSLVVDRRRHVGGNCHDALHAAGVLVHTYGPHYFRTDSDAVLGYLSRFTEWIPGRYVVTVYSGPVDAYFGHRLGRLAWRSLDFELVAYEQEWKQPCVQLNYPDDHAYTRSVEYKHVTGQRHPATVVGYEHPRVTGEPFYPVPGADSRRLHAAYRDLADHARRTERTYFAGRLATYAYLNMDQAVAAALEAFADIERDWLASRERRAVAGRG